MAAAWTSFRKLWIALALVVFGSFAVLIVTGHHGLQQAPPIPDRVVTTSGEVLFEGETIRDGQNAWQSIGGQEIGSIFGHGAYVAPDWTADYLHRESVLMLERWARLSGAPDYDSLSPEGKAAIRAHLEEVMRTNTYDPQTRTVVIDPARAATFKLLEQHYADVFSNGREEYAIQKGALTDPAKLHAMAAFFWWTSWVSSTNRPGEDVTYTQNWPHEPLVGNRATGESLVWSVVSFVLLLGAVGGMVWYFAARPKHGTDEEPPARDPLLGLHPTPSQQATRKFFWVVAALWVVQVALGAVAAHYGVEGSAFYGLPIDTVLPYAVVRTWHLQLGIFWIATSWLATGLFVAPAVSGAEPKGQRIGVNVLFGALILVVVGSLAGIWLGVQQKLGNTWFWLGAQGYEYVDIGRLWQILLLGGLVFWLWLMTRAIRPALRHGTEGRSLLVLFLIASVAIPLFYSAGLFYGQRSHIVRAEYWRWWVVHLWVEGFFEVFATVVIAFLFTRLRLLSVRTATGAVLFSTVVFLSGGILGTYHHLYFAGFSSVVIALGAVFSALEVVPLVLVGFEAYENLRLSRGTEKAKWISAYKWPIYFFVAVAFWNLVGAGLFGFFINPPIALYYMQGLNTTPVHGHTALFGVYGTLGLGLMLFCLRALKPGRAWREGPLKLAFWCIHGGLLAQVLLSVLPVGLLQTWAAVETGTWWARSPEFLQTGLMDTLRWLRVIGDTIFAIGALVLGWFVLGLATGWSYAKHGHVDEGESHVRETIAPAG